MLTQETSLLTRSRSVHPPVPFLLTLETYEQEFAADWLDWGAYDFILKPVDEVQVIDSVREAVSLYTYRTMIQEKEKVLQRLRRRRDLYRERSAGTPLGPDVGRLLDTSISRIEQARHSLLKSSERIVASLEILKDRCVKNELLARYRAMQCLLPFER
jgi:FixJ family two-component response regulator